jgi:glycosyltransferase involved in cell wall biosynthesis
MKIAYVIDSLALSGAQKHLVQLVQGMRTRGHEAVVYCLNDKVHPTRRAGLIAADARVRVIGKARVACGAAVVQLAAAMRREQTAVVVTVLFVSDVVGRLAGRLAGVPVVTCLQARNVNFQGWRKALLRVTAGLNSYTISNSRAAIAFAAEHEGADPARCYYVPNAIQVPAGLLPAPDWGSCGWPELVGQRVIGSVGRLVSQKGYDILLAAFARLAASHGDVSLLVVGSGPAAALNAEAKVLGLNGRVVFAGERADVPALLPGLTLYVQPSRFEGMPNALMEAMAAGLPVVASAVDGITELINDGVDGWLVPPGDAATLAAVLTRILDDAPGSGKMGMQARRTAIERFSLERMIEAYEEILGRACSRRS